MSLRDRRSDGVEILAPIDLDLRRGYDRRVVGTNGKPLAERLEEMRAQLAWVRDYL